MRQFKDYSDDAVESWWGRQTPLGLFLKFVGLCIVLSLFFGVIGLIGGWFSEAKRQVSPANVKANWQFAYDYDRSLDAITRQWCTADAAEKAEPDPAIKSQRTNQRIAIENNYNRVKGEYDAHLADAFRQKYIRPHDVPAQAPDLQQNVEENC